MSTTTKGATGVTVWFVNPGLTVHTSDTFSTDSFVARAGQVFVVDGAARRAATDRLGRCTWDLTEDEQVQRYGKVMFRRGLPPADFAAPMDDAARDEARHAALHAASLLPTLAEQQAAAADVRRRLGSASSATSKTLRTFS